MLRVAITEPFKGSGNYATIPLDKYWLTDTHPEYQKGMDHADHVCQQFHNVFKEMAPDLINQYDLRLYPNKASGFSVARMDGCLIMSMSQLDWRHMDIGLNQESLLSEQAIMLCGAGNDGDDGESAASERNDVWSSIGAVDKSGNPKYYSSYGNGHVDFVGVSGQYGWEGTSFSCPTVAALVAIYYLRHYDAMGYYPSPKAALKWLKMNAHDVWEDGHDLKTGYGLIKLPKRWEFSDVIYPIDKLHIRIERTWVDGVMTEKEVNNRVPVQNINGRLMVGLRDTSESLGLTVRYNNLEREAYIGL